MSKLPTEAPPPRTDEEWDVLYDEDTELDNLMPLSQGWERSKRWYKEVENIRLEVEYHKYSPESATSTGKEGFWYGSAWYHDHDKNPRATFSMSFDTAEEAVMAVEKWFREQTLDDGS